MKKILSLLLAVVLVLSLAACGGGKNDPTTEPTTEPTDAPTTEPTQAPTTEPTEAPTTEPVDEKALSSFSLSVMENFAPVKTLYISDNGDGTVFVEYLGDFRKMSFAFDAAALTEIANALATLDLTTLGEDVYDEGTTACSLYVGYTDGSMVMYSYSGEAIPEAFTTILNTMDAAFQTALADLEVYVPEAAVMGDVDADILAAMQEILNNSGIANLDSLAITDIPMDEFFGLTAGLSGSDGLTAGAICQNMMMGGAVYQIVIVAVNPDANIHAVFSDFEVNLDFGKWVCVRPTDAMIAHKGNLVLCLMATDASYTGTATAIENAGWTVYKTLTDPGM